MSRFIDDWKGIWSADTVYRRGDVVVMPDGESFLAVADPVMGVGPADGDPWVTIAAIHGRRDPLAYQITPAAGFVAQTPALFWFFQGGRIWVHGSVMQDNDEPLTPGQHNVATITQQQAWPVVAKIGVAPTNNSPDNASGGMRVQVTNQGVLSVYVTEQSPNVTWASFANFSWEAVRFTTKGLTMSNRTFSQAALNGFSA
jgi:hypothetical protein